VLGFRGVVGYRGDLRAAALATVATLATGGAVGCSTSSSGGSDASDEHPITGVSPDAGGEDASEGGPTTLMTTLRVAQLSSDLGTIDLCYRASAAETFTGPILASAPASSDAGMPDDAGPDAADAASFDAGALDVGALDAGPADSGVIGTPDVAVADAGPADAASPDATMADATLTDATVGPDGSPSDATADVSADAGPTTGLAYLQVSSYVTIAGAGTFDVVIVPGGQGECTNAILEREVTLNPGSRATLALQGSAGIDAGAPGALGMITMVDDPAVVAGATRTRVFDAARGPFGVPSPATLAVGVKGTPSLSLALAAPNAAPMPNATPPTADALGYHTDVPVAAPAELRIQDADAGVASWLSVPADLQLVAGTIHTGFIVADPVYAFAVLWCDDTNFGTAASSCTLLVRGP